jgi:hypothetical protein
VVDLARVKDSDEWFIQDAVDATVAIGEEMIAKSLEICEADCLDTRPGMQ